MGFKRTSEGRVFFQSPEDEREGQARDMRDYDFETPINLERKAPPPPQKKPLQPANLQGAGAQTQMQIIALLKALNERLKITQAERNKMAEELETYRALIEDLQKKSNANEEAYMALTQKISKGGNSAHAESLARDALQELEETRKLLLDLEGKATRADTGVAALRKAQAEHTEKMNISINHTAALTKRVKDTEAFQEQIGARVDDALGQQARLSRKLDKAIEERARFMRKLERIEETVLQTRDSLNAKAMVLLTDQGVAQTEGAGAALERGMPAAYTPGEHAHPYAAQNVQDQNSKILQTVGIGLLIVAALLGGWLLNVYQTQNAGTQSTAAQAPISNAETSEAAAEISEQDYAAAVPGTAAEITSMDWSIENENGAFTPGVEDGAQTDYNTAQPEMDDIGTLDLNDPAAVEALLADNPQAVAQSLNEIGPGEASFPESVIVADAAKNAIETAEAPIEIDEPAPPPPQAAQAQASAPPETVTPPQQAEAEPTAAAPAVKNVSTAPQDPKGLIKADANLPEVVKKIEAKAFDGVPEAQHDLAAIYTAGHGGVKQDYKRAAFWFEQAANRGVANAAYNLGVLNHQGLGLDADLETAIGWYSKAASLGHPEAQYNLGIAYIEGIGVPYNAEKAAQYFKNAADNGIMEAAYNLGLIYENGLLGEAQPDQALMWYKTAADAGSKEAREALQQLAKSLNVKIEDVNSLAESVKAQKKTVDDVSAIEPAAGVDFAANAQEISNQQIIAAQVQEYLMRMGLYPGPADGVMGPLTEDAVRSYQKLHNLEQNGQISQNLLSHMLANEAEDFAGQGSQL